MTRKCIQKSCGGLKKQGESLGDTVLTEVYSCQLVALSYTKVQLRCHGSRARLADVFARKSLTTLAGSLQTNVI